MGQSLNNFPDNQYSHQVCEMDKMIDNILKECGCNPGCPIGGDGKPTREGHKY